MKRIKLLSVFLLFGLTTNAQQLSKESYLSVSFKTDVKNALVGSEPTDYKPALNYQIKVNMVSDNFELAPGYERFNEIDFERFSLDFGWHSQRYIPLGFKEFDFTIVPSAGFSMIKRYSELEDGHPMFFAVQGSLSFRYKLSDKLLIDWTVEGITRSDIKYLYPNDPHKGYTISNYVGIHYIIK